MSSEVQISTGNEMKTRHVLAAILAACSAMGTICAEANDLYGLLRERDLSPFGILRLDMRPAYALSIQPGQWAVEVGVGYQNTWALSPNVEHYLESIEKNGRHAMGPADIAAIQGLPGENYLVDTELGMVDFTLHYRFSQTLTGYATLSAITYQGGFLDSTIEQFHSTFGFSTFGRHAINRNDVNMLLFLKSAHYESLGAPTHGGMTDPSFGLRYAGITLPGKWRLVVEGAVKVPYRSHELLITTGRTDFGAQASLQHVGDHQAFYISTEVVYYGGSVEPVPQDATYIPTLVFGYERALSARTNFNVQGYISKSVYSRKETDLDELLGNKYQVSVGFRHRTEHFVYTYGITENLQNIDNTPDIGVQFGLAYVPFRK
jgi:Protein of unknown function (DUF3187)